MACAGRIEGTMRQWAQADHSNSWWKAQAKCCSMAVDRTCGRIATQSHSRDRLSPHHRSFVACRCRRWVASGGETRADETGACSSLNFSCLLDGLRLMG